MLSRTVGARACALGIGAGLIVATFLGPGLAAAQPSVPMAPASAAQPAPPSAPPNDAASTSTGVGATTQTNASEPGATVGEVVVVATRRNQQLRDVASTVNVVTGAQIAADGPIVNTGSLLKTVPGVRFNDLNNPLLSEVSIRGSGTERATGADPAVGLFANGVYVGGGIAGGGYGRNFSLIDSFDLDHAEILEGPQGALYGRNAEFGVVNLLSSQPKFNDSGYVDEGYSFENEANRATGVVNYKVDDDIAVRLGVESINQSGGFFYNPDQDKYYDATNGWMGRAQLRYRHEHLDVTFLAQIQRMDLPQFNSSDDIPAPYFPTIPKGFFQNPYSVGQNGENLSRENISQGGILLNYDFGWSKLTSTSSYRERSTTRDYDNDNIDVAQEAAFQAMGEKGTYPIAQNDSFDREKVIYQDLHLAGTTLGGRLNWLGGGEFLQQHGDSVNTVTANPCATNAAPNPVVGAGLCAGTPSQPQCILLLPTSKPCPAVFPAVSGTGSWGSDAEGEGYYNSYSFYGSLSYKLPFGFIVTGDGRYTDDHKTYNQSNFNLYSTDPVSFNTGGVLGPQVFKFNHSNVSYTATIANKLPTPWDDLLYAKVGTGYRAGGFNLGYSPPALTTIGGKPAFSNPGGTPALVPTGYAPVIPDYNDETSISYEIGLKGTVTRFVYFTADAYLEHQRNALAAVGDGCTATNSCQTGGTNYTVNGGSADGSGIEGSINSTFNVFDGPLTLEADGSTQESKYVSKPANIPGAPLVGTPVAQNPHWLAGATLNYRHAIVDGVEGFTNVVYHAQWGGCQDSITPGQTCVHLSDFQTVDLRFGVDWKRLELAFVSQNLNNEIYKLAQFQQINAASPTGVLFTQQRLNMPRTLGVEATYRW